MIDCNITKNYFSEKQRMTKKKMGTCGIKCADCPFDSTNNGENVSCREFDILFPEKAIEIVQRWSDAHPRKTYLTELLKIFPNTPLKDDGTPRGVCLYDLGATSLVNCEVDNACAECWNQPIPIEDGEEIK